MALAILWICVGLMFFGGCAAAALIIRKFRQHTETIKRVQAWQEATLEHLTSPHRLRKIG